MYTASDPCTLTPTCCLSGRDRCRNSDRELVFLHTQVQQRERESEWVRKTERETKRERVQLMCTVCSSLLQLPCPLSLESRCTVRLCCPVLSFCTLHVHLAIQSPIVCLLYYTAVLSTGYCTALCCAVFVVLCYTVPYRTVLCCAKLKCAVPCLSVLDHIAFSWLS